MDSSTWNMLVEEMLTLVFETHNPKYFLFDGAYPYRGMLNSIYGHDQLLKFGLEDVRKGSSIPVDSIEYFDLIVHPSDAVEVKRFRFGAFSFDTASSTNYLTES